MERMKTIKEQVYEVLKQEILDGRHEPGKRIQEVQIAKRLKVSRSPVREAIKELIGEGLLVSVPNKSITVKKVSIKEINEIFDFRNITEKYSIEKTVSHFDRRIEKQLKSFREELARYHGQNDLNKYCKVDSALHRFIVESSQNQLLIKVVGNAMALIEQFRIISLTSSQRFDESLVEHFSIIDFILACDSQSACDICSRHLDLARQKIVAYLTQDK